LRIDERLVALILECLIDISLRDPSFLNEDFTQQASGFLLCYERFEKLGGAELLIADEDFSQSIPTALEQGDLVLERLRRFLPKGPLVVVVRGTKALEAEGADFGRVFGIAATPNRFAGIEVVSAVPTTNDIGLGSHEKSLVDSPIRAR
jgi:hypothetical protein